AILLLLTASLYALLNRLDIATYNPSLPVIVSIWWPLMIYTGWVTIASVVNVASWLDSLGYTVTPVIASLTLVVLMALLVALLTRRHVRELVIASTWGIIAIAVRQLQVDGDSAVAIVAFFVSGVLTLLVAIHAYTHRPTSVGKHLQS